MTEMRIKLVEFIRRVARSEHDVDEWQKFAVAHYADEQMEEARRETVKLILEKERTTDETKNALLEIARRLES